MSNSVIVTIIYMMPLGLGLRAVIIMLCIYSRCGLEDIIY